MNFSPPNRGRRACAWAAAAVVMAVTAAGTDALASERLTSESTASSAPRRGAFTAHDSLYGKSGKLRMRFFGASRSAQIDILARMFGDSASRRPGIYTAADSASGGPFSFVHLIPFDSKQEGKLGSYRVGFWPGERRTVRSPGYGNPEGFIEVTAENQDTHVSEHFRLRDFLTKDQRDVWPKYLVLREELVDKLELIIADLERQGIRANKVSVLSGFRTPQYNALGVARGGRAKDSRHQFGDAADVFIDVNGDGRMDDLNGDGKVDSRDARVLVQAVERVERAHPELVGGAGIYRATRAHGPFVHVDVRGVRARWGRG